MAKITTLGNGVKVTFKVGEDIADSNGDGKLEIGKIEAPVVERPVTNIELKSLLKQYATKQELEDASINGEVDTSSFLKKEEAEKSYLTKEQGNTAYVSQAIYVSEKAELLATKTELEQYVSKKEAETLRGPAGETGPKGDKGDQGEPGTNPSVSDILSNTEFTKAVYTKTEADKKFLTQTAADKLYAPKTEG